MDNRAAEQYLDKMYGTRQGHVAVAYKDQGQSWQECQFAWPKDKAKLLGWAGVHKDANIFICPALRKDAHTRKKGDMLPTRWLWADVDFQAVPADKLDAVHQRIADIGSYVVASGTGDNAHVYVELSAPVDHETFIKLNTGLRDYLYGDNKQADNSLLRLPGTMNWKTKAGSPVAVRGGNERKTTTANLMKRRAFRDAKVPVDAELSDWSMVDVGDLGLPRRMMRQLTMTAEEAVGRYGARNKAVYATVKDLHRRGLDADQIHSLMDKYPAALDKAAEENGYDRHLDIDRCLARIKQAEDRIVEAETEDLQEQIDEVFEEISGEQFEEEDFQDEVRRIVRLRAIRKAADQFEAMQGWVGPPPDVSWSLTDALKNPPRPVPHLIEGLCGEKHNVVLTAQYKTGKTAFTMGSIAQALCDGTPFLDKFPVNVPAGGVVVGHWNIEMDPAEMADDYIRPVGIDHTDNLHVANLRGYSVNILTPLGKEWAVNWLRDRKIKVWTIDSFARVARMAGVSEKDNDEVMSLLMALDEIKVEAACDVLFLITHTGRAEQEEGKERARGATAIDDWADARWIMTKMDKARFLRVEGRGVALDDTTLVYDEETKRSVAGFGGKAEVKEDGGNQLIMRIVKEKPGMTQSELYRALKGVMGQRVASHHIQEAIEAGLIEIRDEHRGHGKAAKCHYLTGSEQGQDRFKKATAGMVDLRGVTTRRPRRRSTPQDDG